MTVNSVFAQLSGVVFTVVMGCSSSSSSDVAASSDATATGDTASDSTDTSSVSEVAEAGPVYFVAIHNEPARSLGAVGPAYATLREFVAKADGYGIKLTLMFGVGWPAYVSSDASRTAEVETMRKNGHEIAAHHHGVYHGPTWDGYTDIPKSEYEKILGSDLSKAPYIGTLAQWMAEMKKLNASMNSGCANDEADKRELPSILTYDTCSGFANTGVVGSRGDDGDSTQGRSEFVLVGTTGDGVTHKWLTHSIVGNDKMLTGAKVAFNETTSGSYGAVAHSTESNKTSLLAWLDFLHDKDKTGSRSRTLTAIIESKLLPEKTISTEELSKVRPPK